MMDNLATPFLINDPLGRLKLFLLDLCHHHYWWCWEWCGGGGGGGGGAGIGAGAGGAGSGASALALSLVVAIETKLSTFIVDTEGLQHKNSTSKFGETFYHSMKG